MITVDRDWLRDGEPAPELVNEVLKQFEGEAVRLNGLRRFYDGEHAVCSRWRAGILMSGWIPTTPSRRFARSIPTSI